MAVISTRTNGRIDFTFFVVQDFGPEGTEFVYDISDDGWKIWIRKGGNLVDSIKCSDSRLADANTATVLLHDWATAKWGNAAVNKR